jgi:hypothetical protein
LSRGSVARGTNRLEPLRPARGLGLYTEKGGHSKYRRLYETGCFLQTDVDTCCVPVFRPLPQGVNHARPG